MSSWMKWWIMVTHKQQNPKFFNSMHIFCFTFCVEPRFHASCLIWNSMISITLGLSYCHCRFFLINNIIFSSGSSHKKDSSWKRNESPLSPLLSLVWCHGEVRVLSIAKMKCFWMLWKALIFWYVHLSHALNSSTSPVLLSQFHLTPLNYSPVSPFTLSILILGQVSGNGTVLRSEIVGAVKMKSFLSGMPELRLGLNDKVQFEASKSKFHPSPPPPPPIWIGSKLILPHSRCSQGRKGNWIRGCQVPPVCALDTLREWSYNFFYPSWWRVWVDVIPSQH